MISAPRSGGLDWGDGDPPGSEPSGRVHDVCVIGSGASGSVVAAQCASLGLDVLVLECGPHVGQQSYDDVVARSEPALARDAKGTWGLTGYPWTTSNVGGGTVFYGGAAFRYRRVDFDADHHLGDGPLSTRWPYGYEDLAPYYREIEDLVGISGTAAADPLHPDPADDAPLPACEPSGAARLLGKTAEQLGVTMFPTPLAIATTPHLGRGACRSDAACMERKCPYRAKGDARTVFLEPLAGLDNFTLHADTIAVRLNRDSPTRVREVEALHIPTARRIAFRARVFVLAGNAIQSSALLLRSTDRWSPTGVGNSSDMVGRGLTFKLNEYVEGYLPESVAVDSADEGTGPFSTVSCMDHYLDPEAPAGMGGLIYENRHPFPIPMREPQRVIRLECLLADQPLLSNRVRLDSTADARGLPRIVLDYQTHPRDRARLAFVVERMEDMLAAAGAKWVHRIQTDYEAGSSHLHGGCRGGADPADSVADPDARLHDVDNVYVADGGFMPFPGGVNPTLTIQAHALRTSRVISGLLRSG